MARVTLIDYGIGNLYSVQRALETCGAEVVLASDESGVEAAHHLVLPGVGAFSDGMRGLRERGLIEPLRRHADAGKPLLGICLGMQMLASVSEEFGEHLGIGLIPGRVTAVPSTNINGTPHKIPHIGWSALAQAPNADWHGTPLHDTAQGTAVYLVHSFQVSADRADHVLATCDYGGHAVTAAIGNGNVQGCQFHPEKSGPEGLRMLGAFLRMP